MNIEYSHYKKMNVKHLNNEFIQECISGNIKVIKYLLTSPELKYHADIHIREDDALRLACQYGHLNLVKYLLTSPKLKYNSKIRIYKNKNDNCFYWACLEGHIAIVKYLLIEFPLKEDYKKIWSMIGLRISCYKERTDILDFLLNTNEPNLEINIHARNDQIFKNVCRFKKIKTIEYLIFNHEINKTEDILFDLNSHNELEVSKMFEVRDFRNCLAEKLSLSQSTLIKHKI